MGKLDGKVAVITGATSGMALDEAVEQIGRNVTGVQADSADLADLDRCSSPRMTRATSTAWSWLVTAAPR